MGSGTSNRPYKSPAMFRFTIKYSKINEATVKIAWRMPHIDAVLSDV